MKQPKKITATVAVRTPEPPVVAVWYDEVAGEIVIPFNQPTVFTFAEKTTGWDGQTWSLDPDGYVHIPRPRPTRAVVDGVEIPILPWVAPEPKESVSLGRWPWV